MFAFLGNKIDECPCYAGLDEQLFYNAKYEMIPDTYTGKLVDSNLIQLNFFAFLCLILVHFLKDMDDMSSNSCSGSTVSTLQYRSLPQIQFPPPPMQSSSAYECYANVVVPKRRVPFDSMAAGQYQSVPNDAFHESLPMEYPQPEYYYDHYADPYAPVQRRRQSASLPCYECIEMQNMPVYYAPTKSRDEYDIYSQRRHLERFGLSKKGLLQIDYSVSWMNLQRLISNK